MSAKTGIQWTDATWNPIRGCSRVSEGCRNCYAEAVAARFSQPGQAYEGLARHRSNGEPQWTGDVRVIHEHLYDPLRWRKPRRIFVNSMSDLFHEQLVVDDIAHIFAVMALAPGHTFQALTKRAADMLETLADPDFADIVRQHAVEIAIEQRIEGWSYAWPLPNVWLGVSVEHQAAADERIPLLQQTPAAVRFLSCEPLLEQIALEPYLAPVDVPSCGHCVCDCGAPIVTLPAIDWVIVGGESGPRARPFGLAWARSIVDECRAARVACFVKQLGRWVIGDHEELPFAVNRWLFPDGMEWAPGVVGAHNYRRPDGAIAFSLMDAHGGNWNEWPDDLRVRAFPAVRA